MPRTYHVLIASLSIICSGALIGSQETTASSLFLKPAFELSAKDHVLLDILQEEVITDKEALKDLKEENGVYPEAFEQAFKYYLVEMGEGHYTRSKHGQAVHKAAEYLEGLLQPVAPVGRGILTTSLTRIPTKGDCISLLIGINYENTDSELSNCIKDIDHVFSALLAPYVGVKHENVIYMSEHRPGTQFYPTKSNILRQFANFAALINQTKVGYFHYSGHGSYVRDTSSDELDRKDEALVPIDYNENGFLIDDDIFSALVKKLKPDVHLLVTTDCCHSGTILDLPYKWKADGSYTIEHKLNSAELSTLPRIVMLSGCRDSQTSADGGPITVNGDTSGALTGAFLHVLQAHHYQITYRQLLVEVNSYLQDNGFDQRPEMTSTYLLNLDDYYMGYQRAKALSEV